MSHQVPAELFYTKDHEWVRVEGETATVGITDFAQSALGDIVFVELPAAGSTYSHGDTFGVVESIKSVSDLFSPLDGEVLEKNEALEASPDLCNQAPYESWMIKLKLSSTNVSHLLNAKSYTEFCASLD